MAWTDELKPKERLFLRERISYWMRHEATWRVVYMEMAGALASNAFIQDIVRTMGKADWVWLEEGLDALTRNDEQIESECDRNATDRERDLDYQAAYYAAFALAVAYIRITYPQVQPPLWFHEILALIQGRKAIAKTTKEIVRDAFLEGHDDEAAALLELTSGAKFYLAEDIWWRIENRPTQLPPQVHYVARWAETDESRMTDSPYEAVGLAVSGFLEHGGIAVVELDLPPDVSDMQEWSGYKNLAIFAIATTEADIKAVAPDARPYR